MLAAELTYAICLSGEDFARQQHNIKQRQRGAGNLLDCLFQPRHHFVAAKNRQIFHLASE